MQEALGAIPSTVNANLGFVAQPCTSLSPFVQGHAALAEVTLTFLSKASPSFPNSIPLLPVLIGRGTYTTYASVDQILTTGNHPVIPEISVMRRKNRLSTESSVVSLSVSKLQNPSHCMGSVAHRDTLIVLYLLPRITAVNVGTPLSIRGLFQIKMELSVSVPGVALSLLTALLPGLCWS